MLIFSGCSNYILFATKRSTECVPNCLSSLTIKQLFFPKVNINLNLITYCSFPDYFIVPITVNFLVRHLYLKNLLSFLREIERASYIENIFNDRLPLLINNEYSSVLRVFRNVRLRSLINSYIIFFPER